MARPTAPIHLSPEQEKLLRSLVGSREVPHGLVQRAKIVLAVSQGCTNKAIAQEMGGCEETVGLWRKRWVQGCAALEPLEEKPKRLREAISTLLADRPRPGCPGTFTAEQICQIIAIACEKPPESLDHWTRPDLVREAIQRGIVEQSSETSVGRFLKSGGSQTPSEPVLAESRSRRPGRFCRRSTRDLQAVSSSPGTPGTGRPPDQHR
jgi:transposase